MEKDKIDKEMSDDYDDAGELDVEYYPIPEGLKEAWDEVVKEKMNQPESS